MTKPVLAFAHANGVPGGSYRKFLSQFETDYRLHVVDRLGCDRWPVGDNWEGLVDELEAQLATLPRPFLGVGHSMGGVVMFKLACRHPDWFSALVMLDPPLVNGWARPLFALAHRFGQMDRITPAGKSRGRRDHWPDQDAVQAYFAGRGMFRYFDPDCLQDYIGAAVAPGEGGWHLRIPSALEVEIFTETPRDLHRCARLQVPGLLVNGDITMAGFKVTARRHVRRHGMTHAEAPGSHMFPLERPAEAAALVRSWLAGDTGLAVQHG